MFVFKGLSPGTYNDAVRHPRYHPLDGTMPLTEGDSIEYQMPRTRRLVPTLDTIHVHEPNLMSWWQSDFERRTATERGTFITREVFDARATWPLTNIIASKTAGIQLIQRHCGAAGSCG